MTKKPTYEELEQRVKELKKDGVGEEKSQSEVLSFIYRLSGREDILPSTWEIETRNF